jgi:hypothetical protein
MRIRNQFHVRLDGVSCEGFTNSLAEMGYCVYLQRGPAGTSPPRVTQYVTIIELKSRNTKIGLQCIGLCSQVTLLGGHLVAPPATAAGPVAGSIGIDYRQPTGTTTFSDSLQVVNTSIETFSVGIQLVNVDAAKIGARLENSQAKTNNGATNNGTGISISGTNLTPPGGIPLPRRATGNMIMGSSINAFAIGIEVGDGTRWTQIIGNALVDITQRLNINSLSQDPLIVGAGLTNEGAVIGIGAPSGPGARWTSGIAAPVSPCSNGSLYTRTSSGGPWLYVCQAGAWVAK